MINVLYPITDLTYSLVQLLETFKQSDWEKTTYDNNKKVSEIVIDLLKSNYNFFFKEHIVIDKLNNLDSVKLFLRQLKSVLNQIEDFNDINLSARYNTFWLKQQHIRHAIYNQDLLKKHFYNPFLQHSMFTLAQHYQPIDAAENTVIKVEIVGDAGGVWMIKKLAENWIFIEEIESQDVVVYIDQQIAWLLLTGSVDTMEANQYYQILGDKNLGSHVLKMNNL